MNRITTALSIMDEKGKSDGQGSMMLWERDWNHLRQLIFEMLQCSNPIVDVSLEQNIDVVEGNLTGIKINVL